MASHDDDDDDTWEMPGPSMERLAEILKDDPSLRDLMPVPEVQERVAAAGTSIEIVQAACEVTSRRVFEG